MKIKDMQHRILWFGAFVLATVPSTVVVIFVISEQKVVYFIKFFETLSRAHGTASLEKIFCWEIFFIFGVKFLRPFGPIWYL
jgi:hypothetical protein